MFQFPGFAFLILYIQIKNTCFSFLLITEAINKELSGGLPHSEIDGSKPILGSSSLIAEYHVLHRLLLPRHPPNALFALDLIQKKQGLYKVLTQCFRRSDLEQKSYFFPPPTLVHMEDIGYLYLTWTKLPFSSILRSSDDQPTLG